MERSVAVQLRALHELERREPTEVLLSHDADQVARLRQLGRIGSQFE